MSPPIAQSAVEACRQYERECAEVARLTKEIGDALMECPTLDASRPSLDLPFVPGQWTHMKALYKAVNWEFLDDPRRLAPDDVDEILRGDYAHGIADDNWEIVDYNGDLPADMTCPHCLRAHRAIQERKAARKRLGAAKRYVRMVGKKAFKGAA